MRPGEREWVRTYEVDETVHRVVKAGRHDPKYGAPYGLKKAAAPSSNRMIGPERET